MYVSPHIYNMYEVSPPSRTYCVSAIFPSSLFSFPFSLKERVTPILHSSFYILHLRRATVSGALPPDIFPVFCHFH